MLLLNKYHLLICCLAFPIISWAQTPEVKNGKYKYRFENGKKQRIEKYKQGKKHGTFKFWNEEGKKKMQYGYKNDLLSGKYCVWTDGQLTELRNYEEGKYHGWIKKWNTKGVLQEACEYEHGLKNGNCSQFHYGGEPDWEKTFVHDSMTTHKVYPLHEVERLWVLFEKDSAIISPSFSKN